MKFIISLIILLSITACEEKETTVVFEHKLVFYEDGSIESSLLKDGLDSWSVATCRRAKGLSGFGYECVMEKRIIVKDMQAYLRKRSAAAEEAVGRLRNQKVKTEPQPAIGAVNK